MEKKINTRVVTNDITFTFTNERDEIFSEIRLNVMDPGLILRIEAAVKHFRSAAKKPITSQEEWQKFNDDLEKEICNVVGFDARQSAFGKVSAAAILPSGERFGALVLRTISKHGAAEINKRRKRMDEVVHHYTGRYVKG